MDALTRIAVYVSPGWTNLRGLKTDLLEAIQGIRAFIICIGAGAQNSINGFCLNRHIPFHAMEVPSIERMRLYVRPAYLMAFEKEDGMVSQYAREVHDALKIPVILRQLLMPEA